MKKIKKKGKMTFVLIRDANRPVWRTNFPSWAPLAVAASCSAVLISSSLWLYSMRSQQLTSIKHLSAQIAMEKQQRQQIVGSKDEVIRQLQEKYLILSDQADHIKSKLKEIEQLEAEIRSLSGNLPAQKNKSVSISQAPAANSHQGGIEQSINSQEMKQFSADLEARYDAMKAEMEQLSGQLDGFKQQMQDQVHLERITPDIWPVRSRVVTSGFGIRRDPFTGHPSFHDGLDISGYIGEPVHATADGTVVFAGSDKSQGNHIMIDHGNGIRTIYMHLSRILVKRGERVAKGETIGEMGDTGRSTGPHLHYSVEKNGNAVNPSNYLP